MRQCSAPKHFRYQRRYMHVHSTFYEVRTLHFSYSGIGINTRQDSICASTGTRKTVKRRHNITDTASDPRSWRSLGNPKLELEVLAKPQLVGVAALDCSVSSFHKGTERMVYHTLAHPAPRVSHHKLKNLKINQDFSTALQLTRNICFFFFRAIVRVCRDYTHTWNEPTLNWLPRVHPHLIWTNFELRGVYCTCP